MASSRFRAFPSVSSTAVIAQRVGDDPRGLAERPGREQVGQVVDVDIGAVELGEPLGGGKVRVGRDLLHHPRHHRVVEDVEPLHRPRSPDWGQHPVEAQVGLDRAGERDLDVDGAV